MLHAIEPLQAHLAGNNVTVEPVACGTRLALRTFEAAAYDSLRARTDCDPDAARLRFKSRARSPIRHEGELSMSARLSL